MMPIMMTFLRCFGGQAGGERADDDRIVAGEHDVDHQHLAERGQRGRREVREIVNDRCQMPTRRDDAPRL